MKKNWSYPYSYYWKKYKEGKCPFCGNDIEHYGIDDDIVFCQAYGGYLTIYADATYAGRNGECKSCVPTDPISDPNWSPENAEKTGIPRVIVKEDVFVCENCHHGVDFSRPEFFQELFMEHDPKDCDHCKWHQEHINKIKEAKRKISDYY